MAFCQAIAQLVAHRAGGPEVVSSSLTGLTKYHEIAGSSPVAPTN